MTKIADAPDAEYRAWTAAMATKVGPKIDRLAQRLDRMQFMRDDLDAAGHQTDAIDVQIERIEPQFDNLAAAVLGWVR